MEPVASDILTRSTRNGVAIALHSLSTEAAAESRSEVFNFFFKIPDISSALFRSNMVNLDPWHFLKVSLFSTNGMVNKASLQGV